MLRAAFLAIGLTLAVTVGHATTPAPESLDSFRFVTGGRAITFGKSTAMPVGYYELCRRSSHPVCQQTRGSVNATQDGVVRLNSRLAGQLVAVNAEVNGSIRPHRDPRWRVGPAAGDCKDYALTKKYRLMGQGWPSSALLIATAWTSRGVEHAVLIVRTDHGDVVLDNLEGIRPWSPSLYRWISVQSPTKALSWLQIRGGTTRILPSNTSEPDPQRPLVRVTETNVSLAAPPVRPESAAGWTQASCSTCNGLDRDCKRAIRGSACGSKPSFWERMFSSN